VVKADSRLSIGEVRRAMIAIEDAGFQGVGLIAKRPGEKAEGK
jgi:biopolymer transport protein ExbD